jgi:hypothetical protein
VVNAYHFGRYIDPGDSLVMHEKHEIYRVEEISRWDLHSAASDGNAFALYPPRDAAFSPTPVNDAVLAEVNSQRLATARIMAQSKSLMVAVEELQQTLQDAKSNRQATASLIVSVESLRKRIAVLETAQTQTPTNAQKTNTPPDLNP